MKKLLFFIAFIFLFASGSEKKKQADTQLKDVSKSVDDFIEKMDRLEVSTSKLNNALK